MASEWAKGQRVEAAAVKQLLRGTPAAPGRWQPKTAEIGMRLMSLSLRAGNGNILDGVRALMSKRRITGLQSDWINETHRAYAIEQLATRIATHGPQRPEADFSELPSSLVAAEPEGPPTPPMTGADEA
jgi:hypothetical protein